MGFNPVKDMVQVPKAVLKNMSGVIVITTNQFYFYKEVNEVIPIKPPQKAVAEYNQQVYRSMVDEYFYILL